MARSFLGVFGQHLYHSAALIVTLVGTVATFVYARDYAWIQLTVLVVFLAAACSFCLQTFRDKETARRAEEGERQRRLQAEAGVEREKQKAQEQIEAERQQRLEVEGKVYRAVVERLEGYQRMLGEYALSELMRSLLTRMGFAGRMRLFNQSLSKSMEVRKVETLAGRLFVIATLDAAAMKHLRLRDPFFLMEHAVSGAETKVALLRLNQPPDPARKVAHFHVEEAYGSAREVLEALVGSDAIEPLQRYRIKVVLDLGRYRNLRIEGAIELVKLLMAEADLGTYQGEGP